MDLKKHVKEGVIIDTAEEFEITPKDFNPEKHLRADMWDSLSVADLWSQRLLLQARINMAGNVGHKVIQQQLMQGMKRLELIIEEKTLEQQNPNEYKPFTVI